MGKSAPSSNKNISAVRVFSNLAQPVAVTLLFCKLLPAQLWVGNDEKSLLLLLAQILGEVMQVSACPRACFEEGRGRAACPIPREVFWGAFLATGVDVEGDVSTDALGGHTCACLSRELPWGWRNGLACLFSFLLMLCSLSPVVGFWQSWP